MQSQYLYNTTKISPCTNLGTFTCTVMFFHKRQEKLRTAISLGYPGSVRYGPIIFKLKLPDTKHDMIGLHYTVSCLFSSIVCGSSSSPPHEYVSLRFIATLCVLYMTNSIRFNVLKRISTIQTINCVLMVSCNILSYSRLLTIIQTFIYTYIYICDPAQQNQE